MDPNEQREKARDFAKANIRELAFEVNEWSDTARLRDGRLRELAVLCEFAGEHYALRVAEDFARRAAFDFVINATPDTHKG
jgi:hypothetical protein